MPIKRKLRFCPICGDKIIGRSDKIFCALSCKNEYHNRRLYENLMIANNIDKMLHRNRVLLQELYEEAGNRSFSMSKSRLAKKGFKFDFYTNATIGTNQQRYQLVYDFGWTIGPNQQVKVHKIQLEKSYLYPIPRFAEMH